MILDKPSIFFICSIFIKIFKTPKAVKKDKHKLMKGMNSQLKEDT